MKTCDMPGCNRAAMSSSGGNDYAYCEPHARALLSQAFAPKERVPEWVRRMQESRGVVKDWTKTA